MGKRLGSWGVRESCHGQPTISWGVRESRHGQPTFFYTLFLLRVPPPAPRWPLSLLFLFLCFLLVGAMLLLPLSGVPCCPHVRLARAPYLVLSYVNGLPPI